MSAPTCVTCGGTVVLPDDVETGEILDCSDCGTELEVLDTEPIELAEAPELAEDWGE
jgi:alpha-aminoadipate carrier protein LysW